MVSDRIPVTIDVSKWRTGRHGPNQTGLGETELLNNQGFSCCLGFIVEEELRRQQDLSCDLIESKPHLGCGTPVMVGSLLRDSALLAGRCDSQLSSKAMRINDDRNTSVQEKITALELLFADSKYALTFINQDTPTYRRHQS